MAGETLKKIGEFEGRLEKEFKDWKSKLVGGLDNTQVFIVLVLLSCFYIIYGVTNYSLGNTRYTDSVTSECHCRQRAQNLYRLWFSLFLVLWFLVHTYIFLERSFKSLEHYRVKNCGKLMEAIRSCIHSKCKDFCSKLYSCITSCCSSCPGNRSRNNLSTQNCNKDELNDRDRLNNKHYKRILWYRYYKLYVAGYSKNLEPEPLKPKGSQNNKGNDDLGDQFTCCCTQSELCCKVKCGECYGVIFNTIRFLLVVLKYIAQLATVPILMLQVFDTYAFLCFSLNSNYCTTASEYKIHLVQAVITMSFYFCIAIAWLSSTLLEWQKPRDTQQSRNVPTAK